MNVQNTPLPGSPGWNDAMFLSHPTPSKGIAGLIENNRNRHISHAILKRATSSEPVIVEIGCESGKLMGAILGEISNSAAIGIDISEKALAEASSYLGNNIRLMLHDITKGRPPLSVKKVDFLVCSEVLEHIPEVEKAIDGLADTAGPGSVVIITVPEERLKNRVKSLLRSIGLLGILFKDIENGPSEWHVHSFRKEDILSLLQKRFDIIDYKKILLHQLIIVKKR